MEGLRVGETAYTVDAIKVDDLVAEHAFERVDLLKVDVEGHELDVLAGANVVIGRHNPLIIIEFNLWTIMAYSDDSPLRFLRELADEYEFVGRVRADGSVAAIPKGDVAGFVHGCTTTGECVHNLVLRRRTDGFVTPSQDDLSSKSGPEDAAEGERAPGPDSSVLEAVLERDAARRERDELRSELARLREDYDAVVQSRSWRYTSFLRRFVPNR